MTRIELIFADNTEKSGFFRYIRVIRVLSSDYFPPSIDNTWPLIHPA